MNSREAADFFSQEARKQIDILNAGRRQGTISADMDRQMMGQINHLLALSNEARNSPSGPASPPKNSAAFDSASREVADQSRHARTPLGAAEREMADFTRNAVKNARPGMSPPPPRGKAKRGEVSPARESRTEGAPSGDLGVEPVAKPARKSPPLSATAKALVAQGISPERAVVLAKEMDAESAQDRGRPQPPSKDERDLEAFRQDADTESEAYRDGYTVPQPGSDSWDAQGRNLDRSRGMSERDVQHSDRERKYRQGAYDQMGRGQMNPQQPLELGSAEDQDKWDQWVRSDRQRQARYNPAAEADRQAAEDEKRYERIGTQYGTGEALAQRDADMRGVVRIPQTKAAASRNEERRRYESDAMNQGAPDADMALAYRNRASLPKEKREAIESEYATKFPARAQISEQDARQANSNKAFRKQAREGGLAARTAEAEHAAGMEAARMKDPRYAAWKAQVMLGGGRPTGGVAGSKAQTNVLMQLPEAERAQVIKNRMMHVGNGRDDAEFENKLALLRADMEARAEESRAAREAEAAQREQDRELRREERAAAEAAADRRAQEDRAQRDAEWRDREKRYEQEQLTAGQRHEATMAGQNAQLESLRQAGVRGDAELTMLRQKQEQEAALREEARQMDARARAEQEAVAIAGPGGVNIARGNYDAPDAQASFERLAGQADQSWTGFYGSDAERFDALLKSLNIPDEKRQQLVQTYGLGPMKAFGPSGRSGPISGLVNWMYGD